ncbi:MAG: hypothetical protein Q8K67_01065 [Geothrix sp.]|nr:hypothetical protein [Geothrix sp.]
MLHLAILDGALPVGHSMWTITQPWWEFALRALLVYGFLLIALRLTGKRQVGLSEVAEVRVAILETNGRINVITRGNPAS